MIEWYPALYLDSETLKKETRIKRRVEKHRLNFNVYCIALASNKKNLFDIINANELLFQYYRNRGIKIVGLASSKESAVKMVADIVGDVYHQTGKFDVRAFFGQNE
jgi:hypothetical protein